MRTSPPIHEAARVGFGANAAGYGRGRPDYPHALDRWLREAAGLAAGTVTVDLGAGTGKFVPRLIATGTRVIAIEPVAAMRAELAARFAARLAEVEVRGGSAEALPLPAGSVDAVVCAQAFHWFATEAALGEIARVVVPGGVLVLVWNVRDESVPWVRRLTEIVTPYEGDAPRYHKGDWRRVFPAAGFGPLEEAHFPHAHTGAPEQVIVDRFLSVSFVAALPDAARMQVERRLRELIEAEPALRGRESVEMPYDTVAFLARRQA